MKHTIYTIGYAGFGVQELIHTLQERQIDCVVDVRSQPYSQYYTMFDKEPLYRALKEENLHYRHYAHEFGVRQQNPAYYSDQGYFDFEIFAQTDVFRSGMDKLMQGMAEGYRFALLCAEIDPGTCHRGVLIARAFFEEGYDVVHLLPGQAQCTQPEVEQVLVETFFPRRDQISFFPEANPSKAERIQKGYRKRNAEIGYRLWESSEKGEQNPFLI